MKNIIFALLVCCIFLVTAASAEEYVGGLTVQEIHVTNPNCLVIFSDNPPNICSYFGRQLKFALNTGHGKTMYSLIYGAKLTNKRVSVWYTPSTAPGTTETNGCTPEVMAVLNEVSLL